MAVISQSNWTFSFSNGSFSFPTCLELLLHLGNYWDDSPRFQQSIGNRLHNDGDYQALRRTRSLFRHVRHFNRYRDRSYDDYHRAARAVAIGRAWPAQSAMVRGLDAEIVASRSIVPVGQIITHGRADIRLSSQKPYPQFLSTSLDPVVACCSALRRGGINQANGRPVVYILTTQRPFQVLFGPAGNSREYELLFPRCVYAAQIAIHSSAKFDIVEAELA